MRRGGVVVDIKVGRDVDIRWYLDVFRVRKRLGYRCCNLSWFVRKFCSTFFVLRDDNVMKGMQWPNFDLDFMVVLCEFLSILAKVHLFFPLPLGRVTTPLKFNMEPENGHPGKWRSLLHPWRLTWNIIIEVWKIIFLPKWVICRFHVKPWGCI